MRISDALVEKLLRSANIASDEQINNLKAQEKAENRPMQDLVVKNKLIDETQLTKLYAEEIDTPFIEIKPHQIKLEILKLLPARIAQQYKVVLFDIAESGSKQLAMEDPDDIQAINFLRKTLGQDIKVYLATSANIMACLELYRGNIGNELTKVITVEEPDQEKEEPVKEEYLAEDSPIAKSVNLLIEYAISSQASDIHIEPRENFVIVRYRVDGILREANKLPKNASAALVSRIKILSNLKIDERRVPQDGRFKIEVAGQLYALRVSTLPIVDGEKVAIRILNESATASTLEGLGFWDGALETINNAIVQPHGMILVTGPTGSGKSTTLFSVLSILNKPGINISTIEDPVEYRVQGTNQTQVNSAAGMTFANGLRALLRQDPNIIMIGEIRDTETANLAVQAALTGHLVLSTLHTNNAATSLPRLLDMGIEPFLIASTVRAVVGQRLIRKLCTNCREQYQPDEAMQIDLKQNFHVDDPSTMQRINQLEQRAIQAKLGGNNATTQPGSSEKGIISLYKPHEGGCSNCNQSGYKGRLGIYEVLGNTPEIQKLIVSNSTSEDLQNQAIKENMIPMQLDGLIKALRGLTSIEEVLRVTSET